MTGRVSSRHPASSILGVTLTPCAEGPCETGCLALLPDISFFWKRCGPRPPVLESTYLSKNAPPTAGISQRRRGRRWRKHSVCMTNALAGACPRNEDGTKSKQKTTDPKTGVKYERYGHLSDCLDYLLCYYLRDSWYKFKSGGDGNGYVVSTSVIQEGFSY